MLATKPRSTNSKTFSQTEKYKNTTKQQQRQATIMPQQKRENLCNKMIEKFKQKFVDLNGDAIIEKEVKTFFHRDKINEYDLRQLEDKIRQRLIKKNDEDSLRMNLSNEPEMVKARQEDHKVNTKIENINLPNINNCDTQSVHSKMSGGSDLDNFNYLAGGDKAKEQEIKEYLKANLNKERPVNPFEKIDLSKYANEWDALNMYNKKLFEDEKIINKIKDHEVKSRTRNDLDNQVKQKWKVQYEAKLKEKEYDTIMIKHLEKLDNLEREKQEKVRKRALKEKESRDAQLKDENIRKRIDVLKNKKYERELVQHWQKEIQREKEIAIEKKISEKAALQKTLKDNEIRKQILAEAAAKERDDDIKIMEDAAKVQEKQENDRKEYFKKIERNSNSFMGKMIETVLNEQNRKNLEEEQQIKDYETFRDKQADMEELRKLQQIRDNKKMIREFLDKQCEEKKKEREYERQVDLAQARIWKHDTKNHYEHEKEVEAIIRKMNRENLKCLDSQIQKKRGCENQMTETEKLLNRRELEKASVL